MIASVVRSNAACANISIQQLTGVQVSALASTGPVVYAAGPFFSIGGQPRSGLAAIDASTGVATSWVPSPKEAIYCVAVGPSSVYAGGTFTGMSGKPQARFAGLTEIPVGVDPQRGAEFALNGVRPRPAWRTSGSRSR